MLMTLVRLTVSVILLGLNIALRLAVIAGTLIAWMLSLAVGLVSRLPRRRHSVGASPSRSPLSFRPPEPPQVQDEFTPRVLHRKRK